MKLAAQELTIAAAAHVVRALFTDPVAFGNWMAADATREPVTGGLHHYLAHLHELAEGQHPGPDSLATSRVPTPTELGGR